MRTFKRGCFHAFDRLTKNEFKQFLNFLGKEFSNFLLHVNRTNLFPCWSQLGLSSRLFSRICYQIVNPSDSTINFLRKSCICFHSQIKWLFITSWHVHSFRGERVLIFKSLFESNKSNQTSLINLAKNKVATEYCTKSHNFWAEISSHNFIRPTNPRLTCARTSAAFSSK